MSRALIQAVIDADDAWAGGDSKAGGRYWSARNDLDASAPHDLEITDEDIRWIHAMLDDERRQTQRRMIAALYWRAGEYECEADRARPKGWGDAEIARRDTACETSDAAKALEAAL